MSLYPTVAGPRGTRELAPCSGARRMHLALVALYAKWRQEDEAKREAKREAQHDVKFKAARVATYEGLQPSYR